LGTERERSRDPALDRIVYHAAGEPVTRIWSIILTSCSPKAGGRTGRALVGRRAPRAAVPVMTRPPGSWPSTDPRAARTPHRPTGLCNVRLPGRVMTVPATCDRLDVRPGLVARVDEGPEAGFPLSTVDSLAVVSKARASTAWCCANNPRACPLGRGYPDRGDPRTRDRVATLLLSRRSPLPTELGHIPRMTGFLRRCPVGHAVAVASRSLGCPVGQRPQTASGRLRRMM
jgi:hypothetical protein